MPSKKVAVVTGSNKGLGYGIVKALCEKFNGDVYLTARNKERGLAAIKSLNELGYQPKFHLLDVTVPESVQRLRDHIVEHYGGLDVLVNNAAIAVDPGVLEPVRELMKTNYFGILNTCEILFPILRPHARVVNVTSRYGHLTMIPSQNLRNTLASPDLTKEELNKLMSSFVELYEKGLHVEEGWSSRAYFVSKTGVSALTRIQQREFLNNDSRPDIIVNHVHPGYVNTDLNRHQGNITIEQGAEAQVFLALLPENCSKPRGDFVWYTKEIVDWVNGPLPSPNPYTK